MAGKPERTLYGAQSSGFVEYAPDPSVGFSTERAAIGAGSELPLTMIHNDGSCGMSMSANLSGSHVVSQGRYCVKSG